MSTSLFLIVFAILLGSGFFDIIPWKFNIPAIGAAFIVWFILLYNELVSLKNRMKEAWADIDVQLKRRHDLIPNLLETVKGYAAHERKVLEDVTKARTGIFEAKNQHERLEAENVLTGTLKTLFAVSENYPALKASSNFIELQRELRDTEDKIMAARRFYNSTVMAVNTKIESLPTNILAKFFRFTPGELFKIEGEAERELPQVKF